MAAEIDAEPLPRRQRRLARSPPARELLQGRRPGPRRDQPGRAGGQRRGPRGRRAGAARVRARHRHPGGRDLHGQGPASPPGQPEGARRGRPPVGRLHDGRLRRGRRGARHRLRPGRALARALEPRARQDDHLHRLRARPRSTSTSCPRSSWSATSTTSSPASARSAGTCPTGRLHAPARRGARPLRAGQGRRRLPGPAAARAVRDPQGARPRGHPHLGRRPAQALDRAHVPGLRAEHRADRQRPGGHGLRAAGGDRGQARAPATATWSRSTATAASS